MRLCRTINALELYVIPEYIFDCRECIENFRDEDCYGSCEYVLISSFGQGFLHINRREKGEETINIVLELQVSAKEKQIKW